MPFIFLLAPTSSIPHMTLLAPMPMILGALLILSLAGFTRGAVGFGDALLAMPLLTLLATIELATPLVALSALTISIFTLWRSWRQADVRAAAHLVLASLLGIPFGLWFLKSLPEQIVTGALGIFLIIFALYRLSRPASTGKIGGRWGSAFGFIAGVIGGAYNTFGPPVILYATLRQWPPDKFRATLQGYFLLTGVMITISHGLAGLWTPLVFQLFILSIPCILLGILLGIRVGRRIPHAVFERLVLVALLLLGGMLLLP